MKKSKVEELWTIEHYPGSYSLEFSDQKRATLAPGEKHIKMAVMPWSDWLKVQREVKELREAVRLLSELENPNG